MRAAPTKKASTCAGTRLRGSDGAVWRSTKVAATKKRASHHRWVRCSAAGPAPTKAVRRRRGDDGVMRRSVPVAATKKRAAHQRWVRCAEPTKKRPRPTRAVPQDYIQMDAMTLDPGGYKAPPPTHGSMSGDVDQCLNEAKQEHPKRGFFGNTAYKTRQKHHFEKCANADCGDYDVDDCAENQRAQRRPPPDDDAEFRRMVEEHGRHRANIMRYRQQYRNR